MDLDILQPIITTQLCYFRVAPYPTRQDLLIGSIKIDFYLRAPKRCSYLSEMLFVAKNDVLTKGCAEDLHNAQHDAIKALISSSN